MSGGDIGLDCQIVPVEQFVGRQPVFELVATDVHRTSVFRWVRVLYQIPYQIKMTIQRMVIFIWWTI